MGPFKYYVSMYWAFLGPPTCVSRNSTVNQQKLSFSDPIHLLADVILKWSPTHSELLSIMNFKVNCFKRKRWILLRKFAFTGYKF